MKNIKIKDLEKDRDKVISDIQRLQNDLIGAEYILRFINQLIQRGDSHGS